MEAEHRLDRPSLHAGPGLRIGIDARAAAEVPAGRGRVVRELLRALAAREPDGHRYVLYTRERWTGAELDERFEWHPIAAADPWWHLRAALAADGACDVFLSSNSYLTTWFLTVPAVPIVYDMVAFERAMRPNRRSTVIERATLGHAVRRSAALIAISQATADALEARFPRARGRIDVAPLGVAPALDSTVLGGGDAGASEPGPAPIAVSAGAEMSVVEGEDFVLAVGTLEPRKNLPRLVEAYSSLPKETQERHPLVVVGAEGWETGETLQALRSLGERAVLLGHVSDGELAGLYRRCALFAYPSLGEGFGLPVLEAMAAGAAVLTSNVSSLPEVGGEAVAYAEPHSAASIATALAALLDEPERRQRLGRLARERAAMFSWAHTAELVLETLDRAAASRNRGRHAAVSSGSGRRVAR
jgi:alpha-1,3-rhamnosyl/mannosyltransferase